MEKLDDDDILHSLKRIQKHLEKVEDALYKTNDTLNILIDQFEEYNNKNKQMEDSVRTLDTLIEKVETFRNSK